LLSREAFSDPAMQLILEPTGAPAPDVTASTTPVVPRWEWRSFARTFVAPRTIGESDAGLQEGDEETYLLSLPTPHHVKVRGDRLEVKRLERTDASGLELWRPVLSATFPIGPESLAVACHAWGIAPPGSGTPAHSLADLVRSVVVPHRQLRLATLVKRRVPFTVAGCHGERGQITVGGHRWNTVSFEDTDPGRVRAALQELGLDASANESYAAALKRILGVPDHSSVRSPAEGRSLY
jgi:exopolyphosphatase / guanosine-5'-triphosphate,3'-diphosphate pyrophosphatase